MDVEDEDGKTSHLPCNLLDQAVQNRLLGEAKVAADLAARTEKAAREKFTYAVETETDSTTVMLPQANGGEPQKKAGNLTGRA